MRSGRISFYSERFCSSRMSGRAAFTILFSILPLALLLCLSAQGSGDSWEIFSGESTCNHLSSSGGHDYWLTVGPDVSQASFGLQWRGGQDHLGMELISPQGITIEAGPGVKHSKGDGHESFVVSGPSSGRWEVRILPENLPSDGIDYCVSADLKSYSPEAKSARFNGIISDYGSDDDGDGLLDFVAIRVGISVKKAGNYGLDGSLYDQATGNSIPVGTSAYLKIGAQTVELLISEPPSPGPYRLKRLVLYDPDGAEVDALEREYVTRSYHDLGQATYFARLNGSYADYGTDADGDGIFDYLTVDAGIDVAEPGNYSLMGSLRDENGTELAWAVGFGNLPAGSQMLHLDFDGRSLAKKEASGPYTLQDLTLFRGDSIKENLSLEDVAHIAHITGRYDYAKFALLAQPEKIISGVGFGEMILTITFRDAIPVFNGRYSYDLVGVSMPPISSGWTVAGGRTGYTYDLPGVHMPAKPNDFLVKASGVENLNVGVKKDPVPGEMNFSRTWVSSQALAGEEKVAVIKDDHISPGRYHFKVFGDSAKNVSQVLLEMTVVKKLILDGAFSISLNTTSFPSGDYSIDIKAVNGSISFDEIEME